MNGTEYGLSIAFVALVYSTMYMYMCVAIIDQRGVTQ